MRNECVVGLKRRVFVLSLGVINQERLWMWYEGLRGSPLPYLADKIINFGYVDAYVWKEGFFLVFWFGFLYFSVGLSLLKILPKRKGDKKWVGLNQCVVVSCFDSVYTRKWPASIARSVMDNKTQQQIYTRKWSPVCIALWQQNSTADRVKKKNGSAAQHWITVWHASSSQRDLI